ncbi:MAG: hypothetical protein B7Z83_06030, partial [Thiomonas sp. 20-64-5]
ELTPDEKAVVDEVLAVYGTDSAYELELRTHTETPWIAARGGIPNDQESNAVISQQQMMEFFRSLMRS